MENSMDFPQTNINRTCIIAVLFSHSLVFDSLWSHRLQHSRPPYPSPALGVYSNSCPLSWWCHPTISSSVALFSSCPQSFPASGSIPISQFFASGGQSIVFLEFSCSFNDSKAVGNLISGSSVFSKYSLNIWKFMLHILLKPDLENFEHYFASIWDECNCAVVWTFSGIAFLWDWNENWPFQILWLLLSFTNFLAYWV